MKRLNPKTPGSRGTVLTAYRDLLTKGVSPFKSLTRGVKRSVGRNSQGRITTRHRGGGVKRKYRDIDFMYNKFDIPAKVESVEYDPNRTGFIAKIVYLDGDRRYILAPRNLNVGDKIITSEAAPIKTGNRLMVKNIPVGTFVYNVELKPMGGAKISRSAGNYAEVIGYDEKHAILKMPSSETRKVLLDAWASIGEVSNETNRLRVVGKAGRARLMGRRPVVRGAAMNPVDHPHGGGEGRAGRGHRRQRTKWGKPSGIGHKTRTPKKYSNNLIVKRRKVGKKRK